jgi:hypothetical protein
VLTNRKGTHGLWLRTRRIESAARRLLDDAKDVLGDQGAKLFEGDAHALMVLTYKNPELPLDVRMSVFGNATVAISRGAMRRRDFIKIVTASAAAWPFAAQAQQASEVVPRVGFVYPGAKEAAASRIEAILSGLRVSGYAAPAQIELVARTAEGDPARIAALVEEIIAKNVNLIIANGPPVLHVARSATQTIPIVAIDLETDPVASGMAASLGHPGGNITGGIGHNLPQEAPQAFAQGVVDVAKT